MKKIAGSIVGLLAALMLAGCASTPPKMYPLLLPPTKPVKLVMPKEGVAVQVAVVSIPGEKQAKEYAEQQNQSGTGWLNELVKVHQRGKPLAAVFEEDLRKKIVEKGGRLASGLEEKDAPVVTLERVQFAYLAGALQHSYEPQGLAVVSASTDLPPQDGQEPMARMLITVPDSDFLFGSPEEMTRYPDKAYSGIRATLSSLADRIAEEVVAAQRTGK